jgi:hypothetical protein
MERGGGARGSGFASQALGRFRGSAWAPLGAPRREPADGGGSLRLLLRSPAPRVRVGFAGTVRGRSGGSRGGNGSGAAKWCAAPSRKARPGTAKSRKWSAGRRACPSRKQDARRASRARVSRFAAGTGPTKRKLKGRACRRSASPHRSRAEGKSPQVSGAVRAASGGHAPSNTTHPQTIGRDETWPKH